MEEKQWSLQSLLRSGAEGGLLALNSTFFGCTVSSDPQGEGPDRAPRKRCLQSDCQGEEPSLVLCKQCFQSNFRGEEPGRVPCKRCLQSSFKEKDQVAFYVNGVISQIFKEKNQVAFRVNGVSTENGRFRLLLETRFLLFGHFSPSLLTCTYTLVFRIKKILCYL